jgi:hypothetical protein
MAFATDTLNMHYSPSIRLKQRLPRDADFEIGDSVCLITNPRWIGVVVGRSLSVNVNVQWENHGIEQIDSRLLKLASKHP